MDYELVTWTVYALLRRGSSDSQVFHTGSSTWKGHVLMFTNFFESIHG